MDCPRCGAPNESDAGACISCGTALGSGGDDEATRAQKAAPKTPSAPRLAAGGPPRQCPNCMTLNAATFKFCARCGTPLGTSAAPAKAPEVAAKPAAPSAPAR